jgi:hypothetical protein
VGIWTDSVSLDRGPQHHNPIPRQNPDVLQTQTQTKNTEAQASKLQDPHTFARNSSDFDDRGS